jgi:hypothetical protein
MLSDRGLCDELITRPEESYRLWCVILCDLENLKNEEAMTRVGLQIHQKNCFPKNIDVFAHRHNETNCQSSVVLLSDKHNCTDLVYLVFIRYYNMFRLPTPVIIR